jgi:hypothetical protein
MKNHLMAARWSFFCFGFCPTYAIRKFMFFRRGKLNGHLSLMQKQKTKNNNLIIPSLKRGNRAATSFSLLWWPIENKTIVATPFWRSVRMTLALLKTQNLITGVKTPHLEVLFILLESSWSVDVENDLAWAIRTSTTHVMYKRRVGSEISSLTPNH